MKKLISKIKSFFKGLSSQPPTQEQVKTEPEKRAFIRRKQAEQIMPKEKGAFAKARKQYYKQPQKLTQPHEIMQNSLHEFRNLLIVKTREGQIRQATEDLQKLWAKYYSKENMESWNKYVSILADTFTNKERANALLGSPGGIANCLAIVSHILNVQLSDETKTIIHRVFLCCSYLSLS